MVRKCILELATPASLFWGHKKSGQSRKLDSGSLAPSHCKQLEDLSLHNHRNKPLLRTLNTLLKVSEQMELVKEYRMERYIINLLQYRKQDLFPMKYQQWATTEY